MTDQRPRTAVPLASVVGVVAAAALVPLNSTMIAVALPAVARDFDVTTAQVSVLITLYLVIMLIGQPIAGRVADAVGSRRAVRLALAGLAAFSLLAAVAGTFPMLLVARCLQAACAAVLGPAVQSLLRSMAPPTEQGRVFGILSSSQGAGAASGPVVGGLLVQIFGWRGIFVVNVPVALLAFVATRTTATRTAAGQPGRTGEQRLSETAAGNDRILNRVFVAGYSAQALTTQAQYALLLVTPIVLNARGWGAGSIGVLLSALTVGTIASAPIGGRLGDDRGRRVPAAVGIAAAGVATLGLAVAGASVHPAAMAAGLALFGVGLGAATPNLMSAALGSVPQSRTGAAAGLFTTSRYVGSITTTVLIAAWVTEDGAGMRSVLAVSVICMVLGLLVAGALPGPHRPTTAASTVPSTTPV